MSRVFNDQNISVHLHPHPRKNANQRQSLCLNENTDCSSCSSLFLFAVKLLACIGECVSLLPDTTTNRVSKSSELKCFLRVDSLALTLSTMPHPWGTIKRSTMKRGMPVVSTHDLNKLLSFPFYGTGGLKHTFPPTSRLFGDNFATWLSNEWHNNGLAGVQQCTEKSSLLQSEYISLWKPQERAK